VSADLGRLDEAKADAAELPEMDPGFTVKKFVTGKTSYGLTRD
jgi:hypothetical protein